ncbi:MAG: DUF3592 domain-containing protein [Candidatus Acidiferrales bacterium]
MNWLVTYLAYALAFTAGVLLLLGVVLWWRREEPTPGELERRRRLHVNRVGRITNGSVLELHEPSEPGGDSVPVPSTSLSLGTGGTGRMEQLLLYNYNVRGVEYQAAQDISFFRHRIDFKRLAAGQPASVKYDPQNPTNSIVLCEEWSGL